MAAVKVTAVVVAFVLPVVICACESWRHNRARKAEFPAVVGRPGSDGASWYGNDWRLLRMAASRLDVVLPALLFSVGLAVAGLLVLIVRRSVPACCGSPLDWVAVVAGVLGLSGTVSFGGVVANRWGKRRTAARFRSLATKLPAALPMWMALFTQISAEAAAAQAYVSLPYAALWRTKPTQIAELPPPRDLRHVPAVCVQMFVQHEYGWVTSRCPASGWSEPELVAVLGTPSPGHWMVIRRRNGEVLWPARKAISGGKWLTEYRLRYKKIRRQQKRAEMYTSSMR